MSKGDQTEKAMRNLAFEISSSRDEFMAYLDTLTPAEEKACLDDLHLRFLKRYEQEEVAQAGINPSPSTPLLA